ncbi:hypothetical protein D9M69_552400 [compost metagenome]
MRGLDRRLDAIEEFQKRPEHSRQLSLGSLQHLDRRSLGISLQIERLACRPEYPLLNRIDHRQELPDDCRHGAALNLCQPLQRVVYVLIQRDRDSWLSRCHDGDALPAK